MAEYIARDSVDTALRFFDAVDQTIAGLAEMPGKGAPREFGALRLSDVRSYPVDGFPNHLVFYRPTEQGIDVIAVIHGARDIPTALRGRSEP